MGRGTYAHAILTEHFFPACTHLLLHTSGILNCIAMEIVYIYSCRVQNSPYHKNTYIPVPSSPYLRKWTQVKWA